MVTQVKPDINPVWHFWPGKYFLVCYHYAIGFCSRSGFACVSKRTLYFMLSTQQKSRICLLLIWITLLLLSDPATSWLQRYWWQDHGPSAIKKKPVAAALINGILIKGFSWVPRPTFWVTSWHKASAEKCCVRKQSLCLQQKLNPGNSSNHHLNEVFTCSCLTM